MTKGRLIATFAVLALFLGAVALGLLKPNAPSYQGKSINVWLRQLNSAFNQNDLQQRHEAEQAFQTIGTQAVPYIVANFRRRDSAWSSHYRNIFGKLPAWLQRLLPSARQELPSYIGQFALFAIGEPAKPALINVLKDGDPVVREASAATLGSLALYNGTDLHDAKPALIELLRDPDAGVRWHAASDLGYLGSDAAAAVPRLIPLLKDPQTRRKGSQVYVRSAAARTLGKIGPRAETALPPLRAALEEPSPYDRGVAAIAIWRIDPRAANTLPVLIEALSLTPTGEQFELFEGLGEMVAAMGPGDKEAFPVLLKAVAEPRPSGLLLSPLTLQKLTNALIRIDPETAARAGVKRTATNEPAPPS
jgi:HEAT repeat protein